MHRFLALSLGLALAPACDQNPPSADGAVAKTPAAGAAQAAAPSEGGGDGGVARLPASTVVATWDGGQITYGDLLSDIEGQLIQSRLEYLTNMYNAESQAVEGKVMEGILQAEATKRGFDTPEALLEVEVEQKAGEVTEEEARAFYQVVARQLNGAPYETVEGRVKQEVLRRKQSERFQVYMDELKASYKVTNTLPYPDVPRIPVSVDDDPYIGADNAQITIIQFAEYQCPYCGKGNAAVQQVMEEYAGKVKMVYRDFPLSFHDRAIPAAVAANCAGEQGKYWEMHETLMANQQALQDADLMGYAQQQGLDMEKWALCRQDPAQVVEVNKDMEDGAAAGVTGTPAFFINGIMLSGAQPFSEFKAIIDRELENG